MFTAEKIVNKERYSHIGACDPVGDMVSKEKQKKKIRDSEERSLRKINPLVFSSPYNRIQIKHRRCEVWAFKDKYVDVYKWQNYSMGTLKQSCDARIKERVAPKYTLTHYKRIQTL